ncbi:MAG: methyltransferase [Paenibacillus sp.]|nr:methyltransferase [Paenibacillus sp.]
MRGSSVPMSASTPSNIQSSDLPEAFINRITEQLGSESEAFLQSYKSPRTQGLRINPLRINHSQIMQPYLIKVIQEFHLERVPWCPTGYYYEDPMRPGKHPYHHAGVYYIQEPSAMSAAELLQPLPGDVVLDLAGAPGGKSTQLAGMLQGEGLLIANEIHSARAKILSENIERYGIRNAVVTSATPAQLAERFPLFFDKIMLDAPCSGEGMFRKDGDARAEWSPEHVEMCAVRQLDILDSAAQMLKPGGTLAYSTCTFNREENEEVLEKFTSRYPEFSVQRTERFWPHRERGEGHFVALLRKADELPRSGSRAVGGAESSERESGQPIGGSESSERESGQLIGGAESSERESGQPIGGSGAARRSRRADRTDVAAARRGASQAAAYAAASAPSGARQRDSRAPKRRGAGDPAHAAAAAAMREASAFLAAALPGLALGPGEPLLFGEQLYWLPHAAASPFSASALDGLKTLRPGLHLAAIKKGRVEPAHALALACAPHEVPAGSVASFAADDPAVVAYLRGEAIAASDPSAAGWCIVAVDGFPLGWGKISDGLIKNHYPKGLRWMGK